MKIQNQNINSVCPNFRQFGLSVGKSWLILLFLSAIFLFNTSKVYSQACDATVPSTTVNLTGKPDSIWISPSLVRKGNCCGTSNPDRCLEFWVTLDPGAEGIAFDIASGAVPSGAMYYQVFCGPPVAVGQPVCVSGVGPHRITFCKPGNNDNTYKITSIAKPGVTGISYVSDGCTSKISATGYNPASVTWNSISPGTSGQYNSFLSCTSGCLSTTATYTTAAPPSVTYQVCGTPLGGCSTIVVCKQAVVNFVSTLGVAIAPQNPTICYGGTATTLTANVTGGAPPYKYAWSNGATTQSISVSAPGTYTVTISDGTSCPVASNSVVVTAYSLPILANAGPDVISCANNSSVKLTGSVQSATGGIWSGGAGSFSPSNTSLTPTYTPTAAEITTGTVTLTLTTTGNGSCPSNSDQTILTINKTPIVNAGPNQTICSNNAKTTLAGSVLNAGGGRWSGGAGSYFPNDSTLNAIYTPTAAEISSGSVTLKLTSIQNGTCTPVFSTMKITFDVAPTANAGLDKTVCANNASVAITGTVANQTAFGWSLGTGTYSPNASTLAINYTPSAAEISAGSATLRLTATKAGCTPVTDDVLITINPAPVVNAGPDVTLCKNNANVNLNGSVLNATGGTWSGGLGSFSPNANTLNAVYTPHASELSAGSVTLTLTSTGNGLCNAVPDQMIITFTTAPTVDAGIDQAVCGNKAAVTLNGSKTIATGATWSGGTGTFAPNNTTLNAGYTPSAAEILAGSATLTLTTTGNGLCSAVTDQMVISIKKAPTANAGVDKSVCANSPAVTIVGTTAHSTSNVWSGGTGTYSPSTTSLNLTYTPTAAEITAGTVTLKLTADSASCIPVADDMVITITPAPVVDAGVDQTVCANNAKVTLNGSVTVASGGTWTGGAGSFNPNANTLNAVYTPTSGEISAGSVSLTLTSTGNGTCTAVTDVMKIIITPKPTVNAGSDLTVCANNSTANLSGSVTIATGGSWMGSGGSFVPSSTSLNASYVPTASEISSGVTALVLTTTGNGNCLPVKDTVLVFITAAPVVNAGADRSVCANNPSLNLAGTSSLASSIAWSGGNGSFSPNNTTLTTNYTPSPAEITAGTVTLTLTGNRATCTSVTDQMVITITPAPTINAGPDISVCGNNRNVALTGVATVATGGTWTSDGSGTFSPSANSLITTYIPSNADTTKGTVTLTLASTGNGNCLAVQDQMIITITDAPSINAGPDQTVCGNKANVTLAGSVKVATGGVWSGGAGIFTPNANTLNALYAPTAAEIAAGGVTLTLTTTGYGNCSPISDQVRINITPAPVVNAGTDITICGNNAFANLNGSVIVSSGGIWTGGSGIFSSGNTSLTGIYIPSATEISNGSVTLTLTSTGNGNCNQVSDDVLITITIPPTVDAGTDQTICGSAGSAPLNGTVTVATGGTWTTTGTGTFNPNANTLNASYVPSAADKSSGSVTLTLKTTGNGNCVAVNDQMIMSFSSVPSANAGPDKIVCTNDFPYQLSGTGTTSTWFGGSGTFVPSRNVMNPTYLPSAAEVTAGSVKLTLTSNAIGACASQSDDILLTLPKGPIVTAGPDQTVCGDLNSIALNGNVQNAGGGQWTTNGTGTFSPNASTFNAAYVPSSGDKSAGGVLLVLTSTINGACSAETDTVKITITSQPTVNAGPDRTFCSDITTVNLNGLVTVSTGGTWTGGAGTFNPNRNTLTAVYTPTAAEKSAGSVTLTLTTTGNGLCNAISDDIKLSFTPAPTVVAGPGQTICADLTSVSLNGAVTVATGGVWTSTGTGTFSPSGSSLITSYFPSDADTAAHSVTLTLTTTGNGTCNPVADNLVIKILPKPVVNAGPDVSACKDVSILSLTGKVNNAGGGQWTSSGTGNFIPNSTSLITGYDPSSADSTGGIVTLTLTSTGNGTCNAVSDQMVITLTPAPTINAGPDRNVCADNPVVSLSAATTIAAGVQWSTSGTGSFNNPTSYTPTYTGSNADTTAHTVTLTVKTTGTGTCNPVSDNLILTISPKPIVNAGPAQTVCGDISTIQLAGSVKNTAGGIWSGGGGTFSPSSSNLNATYTPSATERLGSTVTLTLTSTGMGNCNPVSSQVVITITPIPKVNAGSDITICADATSVPLSGTVTIATGGTWTTSGTGTFANANNLITTYTPSTQDTLNKTVVLTLTSTGNGTCNVVTDQLTLHITSAPTVNAGPDRNICAGAGSLSLSGLVTTATGGTWTTSGSGSFSPNANTLNAVYIPSNADTTAKTVTLTLKTTGNGTCNAVTDDMVLTMAPVPVVNAGVTKTICADATSVVLSDAYIYNATGGSWISSGSGTFSPNNFVINSTYVPSAADKAAGGVNLTLTSVGSGLCTAKNSVVRINITPAPTVNAGPDQTACNTTSGVSLNGIITVASGAAWSTANGTGTFTPDNTTLNATFIPSPSQIAQGKAVLRLTTTGNGTCNPVTDDLILTLNPIPVVNPGANQTICASTSIVPLNGSVLNAAGGTWTTSGTGTFGNANALVTNYNPSPADIVAGNVTLTLTSTGSAPCAAVSKSLVLGFSPVPTVDAGPATVCTNMSGLSLHGTVTAASGATWSSTGSGSFISSPTIINPVYIPTAADQAAGTIKIYLTTTGNGPCAAAKDSIIVGVQLDPIVDAGVDRIVCADTAGVKLAGSVTNAAGGTWSSSGGGSFTPNNTTLGATYIPSAIDILNGTVTLTLTSIPNGFCASVTDQMVIKVTPIVSVNAGPDQIACSDIAGITLNGSVAIATGGRWTSSGTGTFTPNNTTLNATYIPSAADTAAHSVTLTLRTRGNGSCKAHTDDMDISLTPAPTVVVVSDLTICADVSKVAYTAEYTIANGVTWGSNGTGSFNSTNANTIQYTLSAADKTNGSVKIFATTTGNGTCKAVADTTLLTITPAPTVDANVTNACADVDPIPLSGTITVATGAIWTSSGTGTFVSNNTTLNAGYSPSAADKAAGFVRLYLTTTGSGTCVEVVDSVDLNIQPSPKAIAGPDQTICSNAASVTLAGAVNNATGGVWSTLGTGTFTPNNTTLTGTYNPSAADTTAHSVKLVLTTTGNGLCSSNTDTMVVTIKPGPMVDAGPAIICQSAGAVNLSGVFANATGVIWSTAGDGVFGSTTSATTTYTPGTNDKTVGSVIIKLTTTGNGICSASFDQIQINIASAPLVTASPDAAYCSDRVSIPLTSTFSNAGGVQWSILNGTGTIASPTSQNTTYTRTLADTTSGFVKFLITTTGNGICLPSTDTLLVTLTDAPTVNAGPANICANTPPVILNGSITVATGAVWTTNGDGSFGNANNLSTTYTPGTNDNTAGSVTLKLTTTTGLGTCNAVFDQITLFITPAPQAFAGGPQSICADAPGVLLNGNVVGATGGLWSTTGSGTFTPNASTLNATYIPSPADTAAKTVKLSLLTTGIGSCNPVTDTMVLTIKPVPVVKAGSDQTVCGDIALVNLNGSVAHATGGVWSTPNGTGTITSTTSLSTTYDPSDADTTAGKVTFVLSSTGMGTCNVVTDTMIVTITDAPSITANPTSLCSDAVSIPISSLFTVATGVQWTTNGTGSFAPNDISQSTQYVPDAGDRAVGSVVLTVTSTGNGTCIPVQDHITITLKPAPTANAGFDQGVCADSRLITLFGTVQNAGGGQWSTMGNGSFANQNALSTTYTLSNADTASHFVKLVLTTTGVAPCTPGTDTVFIDITPAPVAIVNAGTDTTVCAMNPNVQLKGTIFNASGGAWKSNGSGIFTPNAFTLNATYLPSGPDLTAGFVKLILESTGNGICNPIRDTMTVTFVSSPTVDIGLDDTICADNAGVALSAVLQAATAVNWSTSGTGTFSPSATILNPTYIPSPADTADALIILTAQTVDQGCGVATDNKEITITPAPTVFAGFDQSICGDAKDVSISGTVTVATGGKWTTSGSGTFDNANALSTIYHPSVGDTTAGSVTLTLTSQNNGNCNAVTDQVVITITDAPRIFAGTDQTVCADHRTIQLNGTATIANQVQWITGGTGVYSPDEFRLNPTYVLSDADTTARLVKLVLYSNDVGTCQPISDTMQVIVNPVPIVNAGPDQTNCADNNVFNLSGVIYNATGGIWSTTGSGGFGSTTNLTTTYTPSNTDKSNGIVIINLTSTGMGSCNPVIDILKLTINPAPVVDAGPDQTICGDLDSVAIKGTVTIAKGGKWITSGSGTFFPSDSLLSTNYIPSAADKTGGAVYLKLITTGNDLCNPVKDSLKLVITPRPVVNAGVDKSICGDAAGVTITGTVTIAGGGVWSTSGTGIIAPGPNSLTITYAPSAADKAAGIVGLTLTSTSNGTCKPVIDDMKLRITPVPTVNAGLDQSICADGNSITLAGSRTLATSSAWTSSGTGTFVPNNTNLNATYIPSAADKAAGNVNLTLTTSGPGTCLPVTDDMIVKITLAPTVNAGPDKTACANSGFVSLNGSVTIALGGKWSTLGSGSFLPINSVNSKYIPSAADTLAKNVKLVLTSTGNGKCLVKTDTMILSLQPVPIVNTGGASICSDVTGVNLNGSIYNATGGIWSTSGTGTFSPDAATLTGKYTPSAADAANGSVVLTLTSQGNGTCSAVSSPMNLTITPLPHPNAGLDQRICRFATTTIIAGPIPDVSFAWFTTNNVLISGSGIASVTANADTTFVLEVTDAKGCVVRDTMQVFVVDPPALNLNPFYCFAFGSALDSDPIPVPAVGTFQWYRNDTLQYGENNRAIIVKTTGEHVISYNYGTCTVFDTTSIKPLPVLNGLDKYACVNTGTIINTNNIPNGTYTWTKDGAPFGTNNDTLSVISPVVAWDSTTYIVNVADILGCQNKDTIFVVGVPPPNLTLTNVPSCLGEQVILNAEPSNISEQLFGFLTKYDWVKDGKDLSKDTSRIAVTQTGMYSVTFSIGECSAKDTSTVTFYPLPVPQNSNEVVFCDEKDNKVTLDAGPGFKYEWLTDPHKGETTSTITVYDQGMYHVNIYNEFNCKVEDSIYARSSCQPFVYVADGFTPDVIGLSDKFYIHGEHFANFEILIFNRWGEVIFKSNSRDDSWDGKYRGEEMPQGVYPYIYTYEGDSPEFKGPYKKEGSVILIR